MNDSIKHPAHYTNGTIEVWDFIVDQQLDYLRGNVVKYICRAKLKGHEREDLQKALAYLTKSLEVLDNNAIEK